VEHIRIDGLNGPNPCGLAVAEEKPGELNFFVRRLPPVKKKSKFGFLKYRLRLVNSETEMEADNPFDKDPSDKQEATTAGSKRPEVVAGK
jgi:hypothetical protein